MKNTQTFQSGSVRKRGNVYYYRFRTKEPDGTWKMHEFKGSESKSETNYMLKKALEEYNETGAIYDPGNITVAELAQMWYVAEIENSDLTTNGKRNYKNTVRNISESDFGQMKLREVTCEDIQKYVDTLYFGQYDEDGKQIKKAYATSTMRKFFLVLNNMFKYAVYPRKILRENLMQYIKKRKKAKDVSLFGEEASKKLETITHDEYLEIVEYLRNDVDSSFLALPIQIAYHTGMRAGEVCGLTWDDIDFSTNCIYVRRSMYYDEINKCWELKPPKSGKSRTIDFGDSLAAILKNARKAQLESTMRYGKLYQKHFYHLKEIKGKNHCQIYTDYDESVIANASRFGHGIAVWEAEPSMQLNPLSFVCNKPGGELLTTQTLKWCNKVVQKNLPHIKHFHFHCLRHTYATTLVANGANIKDVQALMGHSDIKITLDTYSHVTEQSRKKAINIFESAING